VQPNDDAGERGKRKLVLIGGGHAQLFVLESFARAPMPDVSVTLIAREVLTPYSGMLPGFIAGHYTPSQCHIDLAPLAAKAGARLIADAAEGIDRVRRRVRCHGGEEVPYDLLSIDIGATPNLGAVPGAQRLAMPLKPVSSLRERWERMLERVASGSGPRRFLMVGGGAAGVEVTLAMRHRLRAVLAAQGRDPDSLRFTIVTKGDLLGDHNASVRRRFTRVLADRNVEVIANDGAAHVEEGCVRCESGRRVGYDELVWATEAGAAAWLGETGLALDAGGFIVTDAFLQSVTDPRIFAAGDVAANRDHPRPKAGVFAVRQGPPLALNLRRRLQGEHPWPFAPQRAFLSLISTGDRYAIASRGRFAAEGRLVWWLKDRIDRRFMRRWQTRRTA
jgi:selenide,water dikinase